MSQFIAFNETAEVNGQTILSFLDGLSGFETTARQILSEYGINNPVPNQWYSQQSWLNAFKHIANAIGDATLMKIGKSIPDNAEWPPHVDSIITALQSIDIAYHMNHRANGEVLFNPETGKIGEGIGNYKFEQVGEASVKMTCRNPYPCSFDRGILKAIGEKFKPLGYKLNFKENTGHSCRKKGDEFCIYLISWEKDKIINLKTF